MLSSDDFKAFSSEYVMFAHVTTRIEGRKYEGLLSEKGGGGFPYLVALNKEGDVIAQLSGGRDIDGFRSMMGDGAKFEEIRGKAEKTLDDEIFLLKHDIKMGNAKLDDAKTRVAALEGLSDEQKSDIDGAILGLEIEAVRPKTRDPEQAKALALVAGKQYAEWWAAGREPTSDNAIQPFFIHILDHAEAEKDADLFARALGKLKEKFGDNPRAARFFEMQDGRLEKLKSAGDEEVEEESGDEMGD